MRGVTSKSRTAAALVEAPIDFYAMIFLFTAGTAVLIVAPDWALAVGQNLANRVPGVHLDLVPKSGDEKQQADGTGAGALDDNAKFELGYRQVMKWESSRCSNTPGDGGGLTCRGITNATYQAWLKKKGQPAKQVTSITEPEAKEIYRTMYWEPSGAGKLPLKIAMIAFDVAVNSPMRRVNEIIGTPQKDVDAWAKAALDRRETYYKTVAGKGDQAKFIPGWLNRNNDLRKFVATLKDEPAVKAASKDASTKGTSTGTACSIDNPAFAAIYSGVEIGSGSLISADGIVVTNHHVIKEAIGSKSTIPRVRFQGRSEPIKGKVIAFDQARDIALVKIDLPATVQPIRLSANGVKQNDPVCSIGNPANVVKVNQGTVIGFRGKDIKAKIALRPGNSGGPLFNQAGEQVGVNKSIWLDASGKPTNESFATPSDEVLSLAQKNGINIR